MDRLYLQSQIVALSLLGAVAFIPGPTKAGTPRVGGKTGLIITSVGMVCFILPWVVAPFVCQARFVGLPGLVATMLGLLLTASGTALYAVSFRCLWAAFRKRYSEFTPDSLVTNGPYRFVRHPIYLSLLLTIAGLAALMRAALSLAMLPFLYIELKLVTVYEERRILGSRFPAELAAYRRKVPRALLGFWPGAIAAFLYIIAAGIAVGHVAGIFSVPFLR